MPPEQANAAGLELTAGAIAATVNGELVGPPGLVVRGLETLEIARPDQLTFIRSAQYAARWPQSRAGAALVSRGVTVPGHDPASRALIIVDDADLALVKLLELAAPKVRARPGVHPSAVVAPDASIDPEASIGPLCSIEPGVRIGPGAVLVARVHVGRGSSIGARCTLHPGVTIYHGCTLDDDCILHAGVVIGADGFGFIHTPAGYVKVPHLGGVELGRGVEIGANSSVDRGKLGPTRIGAGTKLDNHVQVAHAVQIGRDCVIAAMAGIGGSVEIGDAVRIAGHVGIADNLSIGAGATLGAKSGVMHDVPPGETWLGLPAQPSRDQLRSWSAARELPRYLSWLKASARDQSRERGKAKDRGTDRPS